MSEKSSVCVSILGNPTKEEIDSIVDGTVGKCLHQGFRNFAASVTPLKDKTDVVFYDISGRALDPKMSRFVVNNLTKLAGGSDKVKVEVA